MKTLTMMLVLAVSGAVFADQYVSPYVRSDGTYVEGHYRSNPNSSTMDNYSSRGNYNPYTGQRGSNDQLGSSSSRSSYGYSNSYGYGNSYSGRYGQR